MFIPMKKRKISLLMCVFLLLAFLNIFVFGSSVQAANSSQAAFSGLHDGMTGMDHMGKNNLPGSFMPCCTDQRDHINANLPDNNKISLNNFFAQTIDATAANGDANRQSLLASDFSGASPPMAGSLASIMKKE